MILCYVRILREESPSASCVKAVRELSQLIENFQSEYNFLDPMKNFKIKDMQYIENMDRKRMLEGTLESYECVLCPQFEEHVCTNQCNHSMSCLCHPMNAVSIPT